MERLRWVLRTVLFLFAFSQSVLASQESARHCDLESLKKPRTSKPKVVNLEPEFVDLLASLVRTPSVNGTDKELGVVQVAKAFADRHAIRAEVFSAAPDRPALVLRVGPEGVPGLALIAHTDTVGAGNDSEWKYPPFGGVVKDGRLYGRGAVDNKGGMVAGMKALLLAREADPNLAVSLYCVPDEEAGATGDLGIKLLDHLGQLSGLGAIYTYPGMGLVIVGHRGLWRFRVVAHGKSEHTGSIGWMREQGAQSALLGMTDFVQGLMALSQTGPFQEKGTGLFSNYGTTITPAVLSVGTSYGVSPARAELKVDVRLVPNVSHRLLKVEIPKLFAEIKARRPGLRFELGEDHYIPSSEISVDSPIALALQQAAKERTGREPIMGVSGPANESYLTNARGLPTVVYGPLGGNYHASDEYVDLNSIDQVAKIYVETAKKLQFGKNQ